MTTLRKVFSGFLSLIIKDHEEIIKTLKTIGSVAVYDPNGKLIAKRSFDPIYLLKDDSLKVTFTNMSDEVTDESIAIE